jgi:hypothetical protein
MGRLLVPMHVPLKGDGPLSSGHWRRPCSLWGYPERLVFALVGVVGAPSDSGKEGGGNPRRVKSEGDCFDEACLPAAHHHQLGFRRRHHPHLPFSFFLLAQERRHPDPGEAPNPSQAFPPPFSSPPVVSKKGRTEKRHHEHFSF